MGGCLFRSSDLFAAAPANDAAFWCKMDGGAFVLCKDTQLFPFGGVARSEKYFIRKYSQSAARACEFLSGKSAARAARKAAPDDSGCRHIMAESI
jgi:hypothetical protein